MAELPEEINPEAFYEYDPADDTDPNLPPVIDPRAIAKLRRLIAAREKVDELEVALEAAKKDKDILDSEVWDMLNEAPMRPPFKFIIDGEEIIFHNKTTPYGKILDYDKAYEWAREKGWDEALNEDRFVMARVNEEIRERIDDNAEMPPGIGYTEKRWVAITRQK